MDMAVREVDSVAESMRQAETLFDELSSLSERIVADGSGRNALQTRNAVDTLQKILRLELQDLRGVSAELVDRNAVDPQFKVEELDKIVNVIALIVTLRPTNLVQLVREGKWHLDNSFRYIQEFRKFQREATSFGAKLKSRIDLFNCVAGQTVTVLRDLSRLRR
jgi:hypothetical protein